jgi:prepilin-type processing-associated H-X9-DG protein
VVIAVIAMLMAILLPALARARNQARAVACQSNLRQWGQILAMYTDENDGHLPYGSWPVAVWLLRGATRCEVDDPDAPTRQQPAHTEGIKRCPMATENPPGGVGGIGAAAFDGSHWFVEVDVGATTFQSWESLWPPPRFRASYGFNEWLIQGRFGPFHIYSVRSHCLNVDALRGRAAIPALLDCTRPCADPRAWERPPELGAAPRSAIEMEQFCLDRHNGYVNGLFLDWSARKVGLKELWTLKWHRHYDTAGPWTKAGGVRPEDWPQWMRRFKDY